MKNLFYGSIATTALLNACSPQTNTNKEVDLKNLNLGFQPNILILSCEDLTPILGCYGDSAAVTPNLDKMASEGLLLTNAYTVAGVCAPSRCGMITGMYPTSIGGHNMRTNWIGKYAKDFPGLPEKYAIVPPPEVKCFSEYLRAAGYYCTNNEKQDYQFIAPPTAWDESSTKAHYRNRKKGQPFFAIFNFLTTHESRIWTQSPEPLLVDYNKVIIPPYYPEHPTVRQDVVRKYSNTTEMDMQVGYMIRNLEKEGLLDSTIIIFYSDHGGMLPREKRELYDSGIRVPMLIRFPNKLYAGTKIDDLFSFVDLAPTILSLAGIPIPEHLQGQSFLGEQKAEPRKYIFAARDRMDSELDMVRAVRDKQFKYFKNYKPELPYVQNIGYRKNIKMMNVLYEYNDSNKFEGVQKLWWRKTKPVEELYDCKADPNEFVNLADNPAYRDKLEELRKAHIDWQKEYGDFGFVYEVDLVKQMWGGDVQPTTANVEFSVENELLNISCNTEGASIAYRVAGEEAWSLYTKPVELKKSQAIEATSMRIGYKQSEIVPFNF